jgi:hypothetical protein
MPPRIEKKNTNSVAKLVSQRIPRVQNSLNIAAPTGGVGSQLFSTLYPTSKNTNKKNTTNQNKVTPLNLKEYNKQEQNRLTAKQDATAVRSPTKPISNSASDVARALMIQRTNTKAQQKEKYYNPEVKNVKSGDPELDLLYKNQWLMDVPVLGNYIKGKAKEVAENSGGAGMGVDKMTDVETPTKGIGATDKDIRYSGNLYNENRKVKIPKLVDQYFSDKPLFEKAKYKPTSDYLTFLPSYSLKGSYDKQLPRDSGLNDIFKASIETVLERQGGIGTGIKKYEDFIKNKKTIYIPYEEMGPMSDFLGVDLGAHKVGMAWDKEKNLPYISVSDAWDFEPNDWIKKRLPFVLKDDAEGKKEIDKMYVQASLMHKAGKPFKVYDRFYFDPQTKNYIPDAEVQRRTKSNK